MKPRILIARSDNNGADEYVRAMFGVGCVADSIYAPSPSAEGYAGLILSGGCDLDPSLYGEGMNGAVEVDPVRDSAELMLCDSFIKQGKPVLGICRGFQLLNVYFGGSLYQHIEGHRSDGADMLHRVETVEGSLMYRLFGGEITVNSIHHQAVKTLGNGLRITQKADDGIAEAFEHQSLPVVGVQWHPERLCLKGKREDAVDSLPIFDYFASILKK